MRFLRTVFWAALALVGVTFAWVNWRPVTISLWSDILVDTPLPMLMLGSFLLGLVPMIVLHRTTRWLLRRRLDMTRRELDERRAAVGGADAEASPGAVPVGGALVVPPPGVA